MIVVDASVVVAALNGERRAAEVLARPRLVAPHLIDAEVGHAIRGLVRAGKLSSAEGERIVGAWQQVSVDRVPMTGLLTRAWELRGNVTAYDAMYVAAAELHEVPLVTCDRRLAVASGARCPIQVVPLVE